MSGAAETFRHTFPATAAGRLDLRADQGEVRVRAVEDGEVEIAITVEAGDGTTEEARAERERVHLEVAQEGERIAVEATIDPAPGGRRRGCEPSLTFDIAVPARYDLELATGAGPIRVERTAGRLRARSSAGAVEVGEAAGEAVVETGAGPIRVRRAGARVEARSGAGSIDLDEASGPLDLRSAAGSVSARLVRQPPADSRIESSAGSVSVEMADGVGLEVDALARAGRVTTEGLPASGQGRGSWRGPVHGGGPRLEVRTAAGRIRLAVASQPAS